MLTACVVTALMMALAAPAEARRRRLHWVDVVVSLAWAGWWLESVPRPVRPQVSPSEDMTVVELKVVPDHARVSLDGRLIGIAGDFSGNPDYLYLRRGTYILELDLGGYKSEAFELEARPGRYFPVEVRLARVRGESRTPWWEKPEGVVGGRVFGPVGEAAPEEREVGPDPSLRPELRAQREPAARAPADEPAAPMAGALMFRISPADASVYLDGEFLGKGGELSRLERGLAVAPGARVIEVALAGREPVRVELDVEAGGHYPIELELDLPNGVVPEAPAPESDPPEAGQNGGEGVY